MGMESFYGGRQGASFIIVKAFDAVDNTVIGNQYKQKYYAVDEYDIYILNNGNFIEKNVENYLNYIWKITSLDGSEVETTDGIKTLDKIQSEGMVQFFSQGGDTTSGKDSVNYGEYVIIDTFSKDNPDNGKIYRRGMVLDNGLAGAEYIGQIVGPRGKTPTLAMDHYTEIEKVMHTKGDYTVTGDDLLPGTYIEDDERKFNDDIHYIYADIKDPYGNVLGTVIGFQTPYLMVDYEATSVKPYGTGDEDPTGPKRHGTDISNYYMDQLIIEDSNEFIDGQWQHPFYQKWQVRIPHGYHGVNSTNIEVIPTRTMPAGFKGKEYAGAPIWDDAELTQPHRENDEQVILTNSYEIVRDSSYIDGAPSALINHPIYGQVYVNRQDCYMDIIRYRETNFDNVEEGEVTYFEIGNANFIKRLTLSADGILTAYYTSTLEPQILEEKIRWIDTINSNGIEIDNDGTVHVYYNTTHEESGLTVHDKQDYEKVLDWITEININQLGEFKVLYNNDTVIVGHDPNTGEPIYGNEYDAQLLWIDDVELDDDGTLKFYFNNDVDKIRPIIMNQKIKYIKDVKINTKIEGGREGSGNQKVHIKYNTTIPDPDNPGQTKPEEEDIGEPINYVVEILISSANKKFDGVAAPHSHLLVYYSDPALRALGPNVKYESEKYPGWIADDWVDLGPIQGEPGGIHNIKEIRTLDELWDEINERWIPPEEIREDSAGWSVALANYTYVSTGSTDLDGFLIVADGTSPLPANQIEISTVEEIVGQGTFNIGDYVKKAYIGATQILFYDYEEKRWNSIGSIDSSTIDPTIVIVKSDANENQSPKPGDATSLNVNGFWFGVEKAYSAY